jgi:hypothetical protein
MVRDRIPRSKIIARILILARHPPDRLIVVKIARAGFAVAGDAASIGCAAYEIALDVRGRLNGFDPPSGTSPKMVEVPPDLADGQLRATTNLRRERQSADSPTTEKYGANSTVKRRRSQQPDRGDLWTCIMLDTIDFITIAEQVSGLHLSSQHSPQA